MSKKPKPTPEPESVTPEERLITAIRDLIPDRKNVMVTSWVAIVEFMDETGNSDLAAFSSNMPPWRLNGIIETAHDMLTDDYEYEDDD